MKPAIELAWDVIDHWVQTDYSNDKDAAIAELCDPKMRNAPPNLDALALRISNCIESNDLAQYADDVILLSAKVELAGY